MADVSPTPAALISDAPFPAFERAFATYWGRRSLGLVIDDQLADRVRSDWRHLRTLHKTWRAALRTFPAQTTGLQLRGTPALTPDILDCVRDELDPYAPPPPALIGPYADATAPRSPGLVPTTPGGPLTSEQLISEHVATGILARLHVHWPELSVQGTARSISVRVSGRLWLQAAPPATEGGHWIVRPVAERAESFTEWASAGSYQLGVTAAQSPEDVADRLYNELGYWWITCLRLVRS